MKTAGDLDWTYYERPLLEDLFGSKRTSWGEISAASCFDEDCICGKADR